MFELLKPYTTAIKVGMIILVLGATFWAGDQWAEGRHAKLDLANEQAYTREIEQRVAQNAADLKAARDDAAATTSKYQAQVAKLQGINDQLTREARDASQVTYVSGQAVSGPVTVSAGYVWLWNSKSQGRSCEGLVPAPGVSPGQSACTDERSSTVTTEDLAGNHAQVATQCLSWKAQLDAIFEWDSKRRLRDGTRK